jgi:hypothetical protein
MDCDPVAVVRAVRVPTLLMYADSDVRVRVDQSIRYLRNTAIDSPKVIINTRSLRQTKLLQLRCELYNLKTLLTSLLVDPWNTKREGAQGLATSKPYDRLSAGDFSAASSSWLAVRAINFSAGRPSATSVLGLCQSA